MPAFDRAPHRTRSAREVEARSWFSDAEVPALRDLWRVYDRSFGEIEEGVEDAQRHRSALRQAVLGGDFEAYEALLVQRARAAVDAGAGSPEDEVLARWRRVLPLVVRAYVHQPERLAATLEVAGGILARSTAVATAAAHEDTEDALRRSERSLAATLESIGDGVIATDAGGRVARMNHAAEAFTGHSLEESHGRRLEEVFHVEDEDTGQVLSGDLNDVLGEDEGLVDAPTVPYHPVLVARDGSRRPIADTVTAIRDDRGEVRGAVVVFRDLTREREHERRLRSLAGFVEASREEERTRIARELHDELAQHLTAAWMDLAWLLPRLEGAAPEVRERVAAMSGLVDTIFGIVRRIATDLRPGVLDDLGLPDAIEWQATEFARRSGVAVDLDVAADVELDRARSTALFRVFQELLTNVARHAGAGRVTVRLAADADGVMLEVADDGRGIRRSDVTDARSLGLLGMRERAQLHGGSFSIGRGRRGGTVARVRLPREAGP